MLITHVKIEDFGPHRKIDTNTDASIVGLLGPNGSGKSNLLEAIKLALSSTAADNLDSYIRDGSETAILDIDFKKGGASGKIYRKIGKSPKRYLDWDGQKYTKADDIEKVLKDILGADKNVLANAVFVAQGELDKLLFGVQSEREELFIKMMLLSYMAQVAEAADSRAHKLSSTIRDFTILLDEIRSQVNAIEADRYQAEQTLVYNPDRSEEVFFINQVIELELKALGLDAEVRNTSQEAAQLQEIISRGLGQIHISKLNTIEEFGALVKDMRSKLGTLNTELEEQNQCNLARSEISGIVANILDLRTAISKMDGAKFSTEPSRDKVAEQESVVENIKYRIKVDAKINKLKAEIKLAEREIESASHFTDLVKEHEELTKTMDALDKEHHVARMRSDTLTLAIRSLSQGVKCETCPLCSGAMVFTIDELNEKKETAIADLNRISSKVLSLQITKSDLTQRIDGLYSTTVYNRALIEGKVKSIEEHEEALKEIPKGDLEVEQLKLDELTSEYNNLKTTYDQISALRSQIAEANKKLAAIPPEKKKKADAFSKENLDSITKWITEIKQMLAPLEAEYERLSKIDADFRLRKKLENDYTCERNDVQNTIGKLVWPESCKDLLLKYKDLTYASALGAASEYLKKYQEEYQRNKGKLEQIDKLAAELMVKFNALEKQADAERIKREVIDDLKRVKHAFSRQGIPNSYINYMYKNLIEVAQVYLSEMETNFTIRPHPTKPVSFQFTRTDNSSGTYFEQNKLSGGQRVRLTIAVLIAIQQLLVPDLGLLVLDEPSMHVEDLGICALRDLFVTMGARMANNESQIWISDHNDILATAFDKTIHL